MTRHMSARKLAESVDSYNEQGRGPLGAPRSGGAHVSKSRIPTDVEKKSRTTTRTVLPGNNVARSRRRGERRFIPFSTLLALCTFGVLLTVCFTADFIRPFDNRSIDFASSLQSPSLSHPFGTDRLGRDVMAASLHGLRVSFAISGAAAFVAVLCGGVLGLIAGAFGGWIDSVIMRGIDVIHAQNHFLFGMLLVVLFRPVFGGGAAIMLSVALTHWTTTARIVRAELLSLRERPFVKVAIGSGLGRWHVVTKHFLPHLLPATVLSFILLVPHAIFHESSLSFLGLGMPPDQPSLGNLLADSQDVLLTGGWWMMFFPGLLIFIACLSVGALGEYWRDRHHPRWRSELEL